MTAAVMGATFTAIALAMLATFAVGVRIGRHSVIDTTWGLGFALVALVSALIGDGSAQRRWVVAGLVGAWGLRLGVHIGLRNRGHAEDPRYEAMLRGAPGSRNRYALKRIYAVQTVLLWFISLPVQVNAGFREGLGPLSWVGIGVWGVGFGFEAIGDWQLTRFKADPLSAGQVMDRGLWRYTRHPNYFGDATLWWGIFLIIASVPSGLLTVMSPVAMTYLLTSVSGKPLLEAGLAKRRPGYVDYVRRTSGFVPMPPRRA